MHRLTATVAGNWFHARRGYRFGTRESPSLKLPIPFERMTIATTESATTVGARLANATGPTPEPFGPQPPDEQIFFGTFTERKFVLTRVIRYRNSFIPQVRGEIVPVEGGARLDLALAMHPLVIAFMGLWLAFPLAFTGMLAVKTLRHGGDWRQIFGPMVMFCFGYALCLVGFKYEAGSTRQAMLDVTRGREVST